jgi:thioredoxin-related protein
MKSFATIAASLLIAVAAFADMKWEQDYDKALATAKSDKKLVMVDVYTDWCGWCKRLDRDVYAKAEVQSKLEKNFVSVKLNPEKSRVGAELARKFGTHAYPHIVFLDAEGKKVDEILGYRSADDFSRKLDEIAKQNGK